MPRGVEGISILASLSCHLLTLCLCQGERVPGVVYTTMRFGKRAVHVYSGEVRLYTALCCFLDV